MNNLAGVYIPSGALWGGPDIGKMADGGTRLALPFTLLLALPFTLLLALLFTLLLALPFTLLLAPLFTLLLAPLFTLLRYC